MTKSIAFLMTGSELLNGDLQESNAHFFSKKLFALGGQTKYKLIASDKMDEIISAIEFLLPQVDALIISGGLGPTSDDITRFALSKALNLTLKLDQDSYDYIEKRLNSFNLKMTEYNKNQALFPEGCTIIHNENGTANACFLFNKNKLIVMLPGPPVECMPIFDKVITPLLKEHNFFQKTYLNRFLTIGLSESIISQQIDEALKDSSIELAYRWHYPYLEIKLLSNEEEKLNEATQKVLPLLEGALISKNQKDALMLLEESLEHLNKPITLLVPEQHLKRFSQLNHKQLTIEAYSSSPKTRHHLSLQLTDHTLNTVGKKLIHLSLKGFIDEESCFHYQKEFGNRGKDVEDFILALSAWQISQYVKQITEGTF